MDYYEGKIYFDYLDDKEKTKQTKQWIYTELYDYKKNEQEELKKRKLEHNEIKDLKIESIKTYEDMKEYIVSKGVSPKGYTREMGEYLINLKGDIFTVEDIDIPINFKNRKTRYVYIKKFIELGLIEEDAKTTGVYRKKF